MVRPPQANDLAKIAAINNLYLGKGSMQLRPTQASDFSLYLPGASQRHVMRVCVADGRLLGYALVKPYSEREGYRHAGETSVYLRPDATGSGHGKLLMEAILEQAKLLGYRYLAAKIWTSNEGSIRFHRRLGFAVVGVQRGIGWVAGEDIDVTVMEWRS